MPCKQTHSSKWKDVMQNYSLNKNKGTIEMRIVVVVLASTVY